MFFERVRRIEARLRQIADRERELTYQLQYLQTDEAKIPYQIPLRSPRE